MEIRPPLLTPLAPLSRKPDSRGTSNLTSESQVQSEERRANERIAQAHQMAEEAERTTSTEIDQVREEANRRMLQENAREEQSYDNQRQKGYETMRELKRNQQLEFSRVRRDGERALANLEGYYNSTLRKLESEGSQKIAQNQRSTAQMLDYEKRNATAELENNRQASRSQTEIQMRQQEEQMRNLNNAYRAEYERMHENLVQTREKSEAEYNEKIQAVKESEAETLGELSSQAAHKIREVRQDTAAKLSAYSDRQRDPFYKLLTHDASLSEGRHEFTLSATVPEHEQKGITVSVKGNELVLSGYRRNEEKLELSPGRHQNTASYQSFSESFPLSYPVDAKKISKRFDGDQLIVTVPKLQDFQVNPHYVAKAPAKSAAIEHPDWPKNLPHVNDSHTPANEDEDEPPKPSRKTTGSRTLAD